MKTMYFFRKDNITFKENFKEVAIPEWSNCETMVSVAKECLTVLEGGYDYQVLKSLKETCEKVQADYEALNRKKKDRPEGAWVIANNFRIAAMYLKMAMWFYPEWKEVDKWNKKTGDKEFHNQSMSYAKEELTNMSNGLVEMMVPELGAVRLFNTMNPEQDIYTYNGQDFYKWDGWDSSNKKELEEMADKMFNA